MKADRDDSKYWGRRVLVSLTRAQAQEAATACYMFADFSRMNRRRRGVVLRAAYTFTDAQTAREQRRAVL